MSIFIPQNPGIGGLDELTLQEELAIQAIASLGTAGQVLRTNTGETGVEWFTLGAGAGDVVGPASATDNAIVRFDSTTGKLIQDSPITINDGGTLNLATGTATTGTAPLKFTSGVSLTTPVAGTVEFTTDDLFLTITTGTARKRLIMSNPVGGLTTNYIPYVTTNGRLDNNANLQWDPTNARLGIGAVPNYRLDIIDTQVANTGTKHTLSSVNTLTPTGAAYTTNLDGVYGFAGVGAGSAVDSHASAFVRGGLFLGNNASAKNINTVYGVTGQAINGTGATGTINSAYGVHGYIQNDVGTIVNAFGSFSEVRNVGVGAVTNAIGYYQDLTKSAGTIGTSIGLKIPDFSSIVTTAQYGVLAFGNSKFGDYTSLPTHTVEVEGTLGVSGTLDLGHASDTTISRASAGVIAVEGVNLLRVGDVTTNATHTGEVTGATTLTIDKTAITGKTAVTADAADYVLISDTSDTGNLKKALVSDFGGGTGNVTKVGTPADNQIGVWTGDGTIEGTTGLTYDGTTLESTRIDVGATGSILSIYHDSSSPAVADIVGIIQFNGRDSAANKQEYGRILVDIQSPTSTAEGGNMYFDLFSNGTSVRQLELLRNSTLRPGANDLIALGGVAQGFSDLHLATGGVINWASNATLTHSTGLLTSNVPLSLGTSNALTAGTIELGHASDTTLSRSAAGVIAVEGVNVLTTATGLPLTGGTMTGNITLGENTSIALDPAGSADGKYSGITIAGTAGAALSFGQLCYLAVADSRWELADADAAATMGTPLLGMCVLAAGADGNATTMLLYGTIRADAQFPALTIGATVYGGETAGAIQVAIPTGADNVIRVVGHALTADEILFNPSQDHQVTVA